jgi:hypothetical protein
VTQVDRMLALAGLLAATPIALLAQQTDQETNCTGRCFWIRGLGWQCGAGSDGCKCHYEEYSCSCYDCGGPICGPAEAEEDEESEAGAAASGPTLGVQPSEVGGELLVVVDECRRSSVMFFRVGVHTAIGIVQRLSAFSDDR